MAALYRGGSGAQALDAGRLPLGTERTSAAAFGERPIESITAEEIEAWRKTLTGLSNRSKNKLLIQLHGIFRRAQMVWAIPVNPLARVEKHPMRPSGDIQVFSPEEAGPLEVATADHLVISRAEGVNGNGAILGQRLGGDGLDDVRLPEGAGVLIYFSMID